MNESWEPNCWQPTALCFGLAVIISLLYLLFGAPQEKNAYVVIWIISAGIIAVLDIGHWLWGQLRTP